MPAPPRSALAVLAVLLAAWVSACPAQASSPGQPFYLGGDVSMAAKEEEAGVVFKDGGQPKDIFAIFRAHGATCIRLRLFVHPNGHAGVVNDLPYTLKLARRVREAGLLFSLDLHYSDTWADPGHQITPAAWQNLSFPQLVQQVRTYTAETLRAFRSAGVPPDVVQIGNEITAGMLWPSGRVGGAGDETAQWDRLAELLKAGVAGVHDAFVDASPPKILIHIDHGDSRARAQWFFDAITKRHVPFDLIGLSYYSIYKGSFANLAETLRTLALAYRKPVAVVETAYPYAENPRWKAAATLPQPMTPQGQKEYLVQLLQTVRDTPNGLGAGLLYWYPESVPATSGSAGGWYGGSCAMFDRNGNALPAFEAFQSR